MSQNTYGMSTIICRSDIELGKKIKRKFDGDLGIIFDLSKKLAPEKPELKSDKKLEFERAMRELNEDLELIPMGVGPAPKVALGGSGPKTVFPPPVPTSRPVPSPAPAPVPVPRPVQAATAVAIAAREILSLDDIKPCYGGDDSDNGNDEADTTPDSDNDTSPADSDNDEADAESSDSSDSDSDSDSDEDSDFENDFFSLDHITPDKYYSDLGTTTEVSVKANYLTKVGNIKRLSAELAITNYDSHLDKYGNEFIKNKKTIRPWEHKRYLTMLNYIEQLLVTEKEKRNIDDITRKVICTGLDVVEKLTKGQVKIPLVNKVINTQNLSGVYSDISTGYKSEHRDLTNKITGGYRPSGAASLGIKFMIEILGKVDDADSDDEAPPKSKGSK